MLVDIGIDSKQFISGFHQVTCHKSSESGLPAATFSDKCHLHNAIGSHFQQARQPRHASSRSFCAGPSWPAAVTPVGNATSVLPRPRPAITGEDDLARCLSGGIVWEPIDGRCVVAAMKRAVVVLLAVFRRRLLAGPPPPAGPPGVQAPAPQANLIAEGYQGRFRLESTVLANAEHGPQLCQSVAESLPPQCSGPDIANWKWEGLESQEAAGTRWGSTWSPASGTARPSRSASRLRKTTEVSSRSRHSPPNFKSPCAAPQGGWKPVDPARPPMTR